MGALKLFFCVFACCFYSTSSEGYNISQYDSTSSEGYNISQYDQDTTTKNNSFIESNETGGTTSTLTIVFVVVGIIVSIGIGVCIYKFRTSKKNYSRSFSYQGTTTEEIEGQTD
ncbi:uncharacterized protein LOC115225073 [Octopus sinensis]|uniref:Uncharacterized protein LOC115225073 n=1 Tax=Octopus sinensis TaxID=2607531 RepID=A0A6P7TK92_9MOLL|nr:uncharacterized protein LOC115225073 [Octopus sinensis]